MRTHFEHHVLHQNKTRADPYNERELELQRIDRRVQGKVIYVYLHLLFGVSNVSGVSIHEHEELEICLPLNQGKPISRCFVQEQT